RAVVEVEQRALTALEQDVAAFLERSVDEQRGVGDVGAQSLREPFQPLRQLLELEPLDAVNALEPDILLRQSDLDLLPQDLRLDHVLHADAEACRLVGVTRANAAPCRADLQL